MNTAIIKTKLFIPQNRINLISRSRLIKKINSGLQGKITLISAPAGFGKTTLVTDWIKNNDIKTAWFSIDENDNNLNIFIQYLISAIQTAFPDVGSEIMEAVNSNQIFDTKYIAALIINDLTSITENLILVFDDFHLLDNAKINETISFLLNNLPPQIHIVMTTREEPVLPLAKLRVKNQLNEIREQDLRFNSKEASEFLNKIMGLTLSQIEIESLEKRTEGWIAGLQLAAISMQDLNDYSSFINSFSGNHMFIVDYLMEEVLKQQNETIQNFLIFTSFLTRFSIPLCEDIFSGSDINVKEIIKNIDKKNLFLIPLDQERNWFRYHHLFADLLKQRLNNNNYLKIKKQKFDIKELHKKASSWYLANEFMHDAFFHAQKSNDTNQIAKVCEFSWNYMDLNLQSDIWLNWTNSLPDSIININPVILIGIAWAKLDIGEIKGIEPILNKAEELYNSPNEKTVYCNKTLYNKIPVKIGFARAYLASAVGDAELAIKYAEQTKNIIPEEDFFEKLMLNGILSIAYWQKGELEKSLNIFNNSIKIMYLNNHYIHAISTKIVTTELLLEMGRLAEAQKQLETAFTNSVPYREQLTPILSRLYLTEAKIYFEKYELEKAKKSLQKSRELGNISSIPDWRFRMLIVDSKINKVENNYEKSLQLIHEAKANYSICPIPSTYPLDTIEAETNLLGNNMEKTENWLKNNNLNLNDKITYLAEFNHLIMIKFYIKNLENFKQQNQTAELLNFIDKLINSAHKGKRKYIELSCLIQKSIYYSVLGDNKNSFISIEKALKLAGNSGYITIFLLEGKNFYLLITEYIKKQKNSSFAKKIIKAFESSTLIDNKILINKASELLIETLSERELEILELLAKGLSNNEICGKLFLSLSTVKWHNKNLYAKLQVKRRSEAVAKSREIGLIE